MANETKALPLGAKCFRWRRELIWYGLFSGAACLIVVAGLVAAPYFKVGRAFAQSDSNEKLVVVCLGLFTAMGALSAFLTSWCASKSRLIFLPDAVRQDGVGRTMTIEWHALTEVIWKEAGAAIHQVVLRSPTRRLRIDLSPYASADRLEIVAKIRECLPMQVRQQGLPPEPANPAGQSDVNTNCDQKARPEVCEETLATFLAAPAPRQIPRSLLRAANRQYAVLPVF